MGQRQAAGPTGTAKHRTDREQGRAWPRPPRGQGAVGNGRLGPLHTGGSVRPWGPSRGVWACPLCHSVCRTLAAPHTQRHWEHTLGGATTAPLVCPSTSLARQEAGAPAHDAAEAQAPRPAQHPGVSAPTRRLCSKPIVNMGTPSDSQGTEGGNLSEPQRMVSSRPSTPGTGEALRTWCYQARPTQKCAAHMHPATSTRHLPAGVCTPGLEGPTADHAPCTPCRPRGRTPTVQHLCIPECALTGMHCGFAPLTTSH